MTKKKTKRPQSAKKALQSEQRINQILNLQQRRKKSSEPRRHAENLHSYSSEPCKINIVAQIK